MKTFKVGDKVEIINNGINLKHYFRIGDIGTIILIDAYYLVQIGNLTQDVEEHHIKKI